MIEHEFKHLSNLYSPYKISWVKVNLIDNCYVYDDEFPLLSFISSFI